jgi:tetratricopeptide (TPR) repeat protein
MSGAAALREQALGAARAGRPDQARQLFEQAAARFPRDCALLNSIGNFHASRGENDAALAWFDRALGVEPQHPEAAINRAIVLTRLGRAREAIAALRQHETALAPHPRYWTARGAAELAALDPLGAAASYDRALKAEPGNVRALHGRAQAALECGSDDAAGWLERALATSPGDRHLVRNLAQAYEAQGRREDALQLTHALATQVPDWIEGLEAHAALRWSLGDREHFCDHYDAASRIAPSPALYESWAQTLAGVDRDADAASVAAAGRARWPEHRPLALLEFAAHGAAGDPAAAAAVLASADSDDPLWRLHRARHLIRLGDVAQAERLVSTAIDASPDDVEAWSLREIAWRMLDDPRHPWLIGEGAFVRELTLDLGHDVLARVTTLLDRLHDRAGMPVGQSVKVGSQTRGALFARGEPDLRRYAEAVDRALSTYRDGLPLVDLAHPLLRYQDAPWHLAGSWSIRMQGSGRHASHIHPKGILSSASYIVLPDAAGQTGQAGWLELGRPPSSLGTDLPPLAAIQPRAGVAVLFPSFLFHGTRPITSGKRMTIAFDVAADRR